MKNLKKLLVVFFFTVAVSLFALAYSASAEEIKYPVDDGYIYFDTEDQEITGGTSRIKDLVIPSKIEGIRVTSIAANAFYNSDIESLYIPKSVTNIGTLAFASCENLLSVQINADVVGLYDTFLNCKKLKEVAITSRIWTLGGTFMGCRSLESVTLTNGIQEIGSCTFAQTAIKSINLPSSVKTIEYDAFEETPLEEITVDSNNETYASKDGVLFSKDMQTLIMYPAGRTDAFYTVPESVNTIGSYAFRNITLDVLNVSNVKILSNYSFSGADIYAIIVSGRLERRSTSSFHSSTNKYLYYKGDYSGWDAALGYKSTKKYYLGYVQADYPVEGGTIYYDLMTNYIVGCDSSMKVVDIPAEINGREVTGIYKWAFEKGYYLESINIPATVKEIDDFAFLGSDNLKSINVDDANPYLCDVDGVLFNSDKTEIIAFPSKYTTGSYTLPKTVERIGNSAFGHVRLDKLDISNVTKLDEGAFIGVIINELVANANLSEYSMSNEKYYSKSVTDDIDKGWSTDIDNACFTGSTAGAWKELLKAYCNNFVYGYTGGEKPQCEVSSVGLAITVHNLDGVKDFFIGKGVHTTYREVKNNSVMRVTEARINGADKYTHTVNQPGDYTICVRFNDGSENLILYTTATAYLPKIETNGIAVTVSNIRLKGVRVIRTAPGVWNTPGEVKRAPGCRNFTANTIGNGDSYTIRYTESGTYTLTLEYSNGLVVVEHIELNVTEPTLVQDGNSVVIGNLDNLYTIRYAKGEYATMGEIKRAEGCQVRRSRDIKDGVITVTDLEPGTYTFCVQYNDNSYHYFTVVVE